MTRTRFHQGLDDLKQKLLAMGGMAEQAVERAVRAYQTRELELCQIVLRDESKINAAERDVDEMSIDLLAMQQPMAIDLRFIVACIKINADLERVGDQAVNIAERVMDLIMRPDPGLNVDIPRMAQMSISMVRDALNAFLTADVDLAQSVLERDDLVDNMNREIFEAVDTAMAKSAGMHRNLLDTLIVARNLERVADHATNIAEDVIFWVRGADVRHHAQS
ncbi:MAG TPA: phosphate signaling complex protein PhoU [Candidatus Angelobacter sp.]|jgi:phosphate transport system protein|nr:phosphate signaling complex protein PhoU [Candidatus Angelobacter sp.]HEX3093010.1 phosphate signaling complex protein PhoU [Candidatus Angelobacter sp.]